MCRQPLANGQSLKSAGRCGRTGCRPLLSAGLQDKSEIVGRFGRSSTVMLVISLPADSRVTKNLSSLHETRRFRFCGVPGIFESILVKRSEGFGDCQYYSLPARLVLDHDQAFSGKKVIVTLRHWWGASEEIGMTSGGLPSRNGSTIACEEAFAPEAAKG